MTEKIKYSTISVRLTPEERIEIESFCEEEDLSMSQLLRKAAKEYIKNKKGE